MKHLIICREYPPFPYPPGGIGTYVEQISRLLAVAGEEVHVIAQQWPGAPHERTTVACQGGTVVVHRVPLEEPLPFAPQDADILRALRASPAPTQAFSWQVARLVERLVDAEGIDVIEAQEYEAPLYFLLSLRKVGQLRCRAPVILHFHSPSELIFRYNDVPIGRPDFVPIKRLEEFCIAHADAWLCPSRFLAADVERRYRLRPHAVRVIPYPCGNTPLQQRRGQVWAKGTILYAGRLEPRKGVYEWVDAAVTVLGDGADAHFTFAGGDPVHRVMGGTSTRDALLARVPARLRQHFDFLGALPRHRLPALMAEARMAAVPSRWENFPNTCLEAMASGLPVLASPNGGMVEMVEHGHTGWISDGSGAPDLAAALRLALSTPPERLATMGAAAAASVRRAYDNQDIAQQHLAFRRTVVEREPEPRRQADVRRGLAVVVSSRGGRPLERCIAALVAQRAAPVQVIVVHPPGAVSDSIELPNKGWAQMAHSEPASAPALNAAIRLLSQQPVPPLGVAFLNDSTRVAAGYVANVERAFQSDATLGVVAPWLVAPGGSLRCRLPAALPYQWIEDDTAHGGAFRLVALERVGPLRSDLGEAHVLWDLANAVLSAGWWAAALSAAGVHVVEPGPENPTLRSHEALLSRITSDDARAAVTLLQNRLHATRTGTPSVQSAHTMTMFDLMVSSPRQQWAAVRRAVADPRYVAQWLTWHGRRIARSWRRTVRKR